mmetsp:Transcript_72395/g.172521  ORF Transcript_72395/g.172521 Transcript_72395/m.172521 type:complete len:82 (+) Transcript_72395:2582-2827(+)
MEERAPMWLVAGGARDFEALRKGTAGCERDPVEGSAPWEGSRVTFLDPARCGPVLKDRLLLDIFFNMMSSCSLGKVRSGGR